MYHSRLIEKKILEAACYFKVLLITGARQVGKSTLLSHLFPDVQKIVFDPIQDIQGARQDPDLFLANHKSPLILDEVQYVPELLASLKRKVDESSQKGQYFLTGSQNLMMLKGVAESMAGRVGVFHLDSMTAFEAEGVGASNWLLAYLAEQNLLEFEAMTQEQTLYTQIWRGNLPGLLELPESLIPAYLQSYLATYLERDVRNFENIQNLSEFQKFLSLLAAFSAQEINQSQFGREINLSRPTLQRWMNVLTHSYLWCEIMPFSMNSTKRVSQKRKGYFFDTGLICYLQQISSPTALATHPMLGALFESFCVNLIVSLNTTLSVPAKLFHWRSNSGAEVDLILERDGKFYPIEIKCKSLVTKHDSRGIRALRENYPTLKWAKGLVLYAGNKTYALDEDTIALPWNALSPP